VLNVFDVLSLQALGPTWASLLCTLPFALGACGQRAVDGDYQGEALYSFGGTVQLEASALASDATGDLRVALFWARGSAAAGSLFSAVGAVEQNVDATTSFPARFTLTLRRPPDPALIGTSPDVSGAYGVAMVLVYLDQDGDVRWDRGSEPLVGAAEGAILVYAPDGLVGGRFGELAAGFHLLLVGKVEDECQGGLAVPADPGTLAITVSGSYPEQALLDINCDGLFEEWSGTCPDLATVFEDCRDADGDGLIDNPDQSVCATCDYLLWDDGAEDADCETWRETCEDITDDEECDRAAEQCRDEPHQDDQPSTE